MASSVHGQGVRDWKRLAASRGWSCEGGRFGHGSPGICPRGSTAEPPCSGAPRQPVLESRQCRLPLTTWRRCCESDACSSRKKICDHTTRFHGEQQRLCAAELRRCLSRGLTSSRFAGYDVTTVGEAPSFQRRVPEDDRFDRTLMGGCLAGIFNRDDLSPCRRPAALRSEAGTGAHPRSNGSPATTAAARLRSSG